MTTPQPAREWSAEIKAWWRAYWTDEGQKLPPSRHPKVRRLFGWYHRRQLLERRVDRLFAPPKGKAHDKLYVEGSTGQPKVNPLIAELRSIESTIEDLELQVFGAPPTADTGPAGNDPAALLAAANDRFAELARSIEGEDPRDTRLELLAGGKSATA